MAAFEKKKENKRQRGKLNYRWRLNYIKDEYNILRLEMELTTLALILSILQIELLHFHNS
jgi:hypothetical protein